tara:strand:+ start:421 stop:597 length:177 start_codon:yes stop_codon:yes gene_type:complete
LSIPFYDFPSSPILIIGGLGIAVAIVVFLLHIKNISIHLLTRNLQKRKTLNYGTKRIK